MDSIENQTAINGAAEKILAYARSSLLMNMRFLGMALAKLKITACDNLMFATDGEQIFYNPKFVILLYKKSKERVTRSLLHSLLHCVFCHMFTGKTQINEDIWNLACDIAVENVITEMNLTSLSVQSETKQQEVIASLKAKLKYLTAEKIYCYYMGSEPQTSELEQLQELFCADDHRLWYSPNKEVSADESGDSGIACADNFSGKALGNECTAGKDNNEGKGPGDNQSEKADASNSGDGQQQKTDDGGSGSSQPESADASNSGDGQQQKTDDGGSGNSQPENADASGGGIGQQQKIDDGGSGSSQPEKAGAKNSAGPNSYTSAESLAGNPDRKKSEKDWKNISKHIQEDLTTFSKKRGDEAGCLMQNLQELHREKYDYTEFLKKFSVYGEALKVNDDEFDYIFYTYGLKLYGKIPLVEPLEYKEVKRIKEFVIAIDTSGSVSGALVQRFLQKTYNILNAEESFFTKINLRIIQCDTCIQEDVKITTREEFDTYIRDMTIKGLGGTDFRPVFEYVDELIMKEEFLNLKGLIYFTDGYGVFPAKKPKYETAFIFVGDDMSNPDVPAWAIKLVLPFEDL